MEPAALARPTSAMDEVKEFGLFFMEQGGIDPGSRRSGGALVRCWKAAEGKGKRE